MATLVQYCPSCAAGVELREVGDQGQHPVCTRCGFVVWQNLRPCVDALVVRRTGDQPEVLLGRRAIEPSRGCWDTPGGFLNVGDTPEGRLVRACLAEVGVTVSVRELLGAFTDRFGDIPIITLYYLCDAETGDPAPGGVVDEARWFPIGDPPPLAFPAVEQAIKLAQTRLARETR